MIFDIGPFRLYRVEKDGTLCISLICMDNLPCGWQYGWEDPMANRHPWIELRLGKLTVFSFEGWIATGYKEGAKPRPGFELWILGFWLII